MRGSVELYSRGLKMARDDSTTPEEWAEFREELRQANVGYMFRKKLINLIEVIRNESTENPEA